MRTRGLLAAAAATTALLGAGAQSAYGAYFTTQPSAYARSGAGPFSWGFASDSPLDTQYGWTAYKLSTEELWHRCTNGVGPQLRDLPDGVYTVDIADDVDLDWAIRRNIFNSGFTQPCRDTVPQPPQTAWTRSALIVDSVPPAVSSPVVTAGRSVHVHSTITDELSGVKSIRWATGDGAVVSDVLGFAHVYPAPGTYPASVTVTDYAGNSTTRSFPVTATAAAPPTLIVTPTPTRPADTVAPRVTVAALKARRVGRSGALSFTLSGSETARVAVTATVRLGSRTVRLRPTSVQLPAGRTHTVRLAVSRTLRSRLRAVLRQHRRALATIDIVATDTSGNSRKLQRTVRITG